MRRLEFFLPFLPTRSLSPNARVHHMERSEATHELREGTSSHLLGYREVLDLGAPFQVARVDVVWRMTNRKPRIEQCPRCVRWALEHPRSDTLMCRCYRPADAGNAASSLKPFFDGLADAGVLLGDRFEQMELGEMKKEPVERLEDEGLCVVVEEIE